MYIVKLTYLPLSVLPREAEHSAGWFYCFSRKKAAWTELYSFALKDCKHFFAVTSRTATLACRLQCSRVVGKVSTAHAYTFFSPGVQGLCPACPGVHKGLLPTPFVCYS